MIETLLSLALLLAIWRPWSRLMVEDPKTHRNDGPQIDIRRHLNGDLVSEGVIYGPTGRLSSRFVARMKGEWSGASGSLSENFSFAGAGQRDRRWHLKLNNDGTFIADAEDIVGPARGEQSGPVVKMTYRLRLPESAGGHVLNVTDWLYLMENGTIMNRSEMRKFGVKVGELIATIRPAAA